MKGENYVDATKRGCLKAINIISEALKNGSLMTDPKETEWISLLEEDISAIPSNESDFVEMILPGIDGSKIILSEYGL